MECVVFVIDRMLTLFAKNTARAMENTLIPGFLLRLFKSVNTIYTSIMSQCLQGSHKKIF